MTEIDDEDVEALFITFQMEAKLIRLVGNTLVPSKISIKADVAPEEDVGEAELNLAITKIRFWYDNLVSKAIAFSHENEAALAMFIDETGKNRTGNLIMTTPGDPTDEILAALFQAKMTSLSSGTIHFGSVEVRSDNPVGLSFVFMGDGAKVLPNMEEWIGPRSYFKKPWWSRDDASTLDVIPTKDADLTKVPAWAFSLDSLGTPKAESGLVIRPSFKPTVIDGGNKPTK